MDKTKKIMLLIESSRAYEQGILAGIANYSRLHGPWLFYRNIPAVSGGKKITLSQIKKLETDGIIVREQDITEKLLTLNQPTILSPFRKRFDGLSNIITNDRDISRMAVKHFVNRGFKNFAFFRNDKRFFWATQRCEAFCQAAKDTAETINIYEHSNTSKPRNMKLVIDWIKSLPKPVAIMSATDDFSYMLFEAARTAGLNVPESVAILGVGNDEIVCGLQWPPLSSIALNTQEAGYKAAELLDNMMKTGQSEPADITIEPLRVISRHSTDILAIEDEYVAQALRFIRQHAKELIQVDDVVNAVPLSRRQLYNRFQETLNRSIYQEIRRVRMNHSAAMLVETNLSISEIAHSLGFTDLKNISRCFSHEKNMTMLAYRKKYGRRQVTHR